MHRTERIVACEYIPTRTLSTMAPKDHNVLYDIVKDTLYTSVPGYLNKLYKSVGLKSYNLVKDLYEIDTPYVKDKISKSLNTLKGHQVLVKDNSFIVTDKIARDNYNYVIAELSGLEEFYQYNVDNYHSEDNILALRGDHGCIVSMSLIDNQLDYYDVCVVDDMILISKNGSHNMNESVFKSLISTSFDTIGNSHLEYSFNYALDTNLTYSEYISLLKSLKLASGTTRLKVLGNHLTDEDFTELSGLETFQYDLTLSKYTVRDAFKLIKSQLLGNTDLTMYELYWFYDKVLSDNLMGPKLACI